MGCTIIPPIESPMTCAVLAATSSTGFRPHVGERVVDAVELDESPVSRLSNRTTWKP